MSSTGKQQNSRSRSHSFNGSCNKGTIFSDSYMRTIFDPEDKSSSATLTEKIEKTPLTQNDVFKSTEQTTGIDFEKYQNIPVTCSGDFKPIAAFEEASLPKEILNNIKLAKYSVPTPIQKYAIPVGLAGRDLMGCAQTGSGKTAAFLIPVISRLLKETDKKNFNRERTGYPTYLILAPTRELAIQIHKETLKFAFGTWIKPVVVYGGASIMNQVRQIERGVDILVATPGRLLDMIERNKVSLERIKFLCFDEADRMLDMGFEPDVRRIVLESGMPPSKDRVTTMFSATYPPEIKNLASAFLNNFVRLNVGRIGSTTESITQTIKYVEAAEKREEIVKDLKLVTGRTLVFCEKKRDTENLSRFLFTQGFLTSSIHGDREQREREAALASFKSGRIKVLVATDVASRGLDIPEVAQVINYNLPISIDSYVHRIGRTGRAGNRGLATSYFNDDSNSGLAKDLIAILRESKQVIPDFLLQSRLKPKMKRRGGGGGSGGRRHMRRDTPYGRGGGGKGNGRGKTRSDW